MSRPCTRDSVPDEGRMTDEEFAVAEKALREVHEACNIDPTPEKIDRDILNELSELRQKVADMETAKAFQVSYLIILLTA